MKIQTFVAISFAAAALLIAGAANGVMDTLTFHYSASRFSKLSESAQAFWNPALSWCNKYASCDNRSPKFPGSTTIFVMFTDGWHLAKAIYSTLVLFGAPVLFASFLSFFNYKQAKTKIHLYLPALIVAAIVICKIIIAAGFHLTYSFLLPCR